MGVCTKGLIKGNIYGPQFLDFIQKQFDSTARLVTHTGFAKNQGSLCFRVNDNDVIAYFCEGLDDYSELDADMVEGKYTYISMGYNKEFTPNIMRKIVAQFGGGFFEEKDNCESTGYLPITLDSNGEILPIIEMTHDELNKHFGGVVIVVD